MCPYRFFKAARNLQRTALHLTTHPPRPLWDGLPLPLPSGTLCWSGWELPTYGIQTKAKDQSSLHPGEGGETSWVGWGWGVEPRKPAGTDVLPKGKGVTAPARLGPLGASPLFGHLSSHIHPGWMPDTAAVLGHLIMGGCHPPRCGFCGGTWRVLTNTSLSGLRAFRGGRDL